MDPTSTDDGEQPSRHRIDAVAWARHGEEIHQLILRDASGHSLERAELPVNHYSEVRVQTHPSGRVGLFEFSMDSGASCVRAAWTEHETLRTHALFGGENVIRALFDPSGQRLLVVTHTAGTSVVRLLAWPSMTELGRLHAGRAGAEHGWGGAVSFTHDGGVLLSIAGGGLVSTDHDLGSVRHVDFGAGNHNGPDIEDVRPLGATRFAFRFRDAQGLRSSEWDVA